MTNLANSAAEAVETDVMRAIARVANQTGVQCYAVGGFVRDLAMGRSSKDVDVVVEGDGPAFARELSIELGVQDSLRTYERFGTAAMTAPDGTDLEVVGARSESYTPESRKPTVRPGTIREDQLRRDFTVNAMAIALGGDAHGSVVDPFEGQRDLKAGILRTPAEPDVTFSDDPLRMLRAVRFHAQLGLNPTWEVKKGMMRNAHRLRIVSQERIHTELNKTLMAPNPRDGLLLASETGLLREFLPELEALRGAQVEDGVSHKDNFHHTLKVLEGVVERGGGLWVRWAALLHDVGKASTKRFEPGLGWTFHGHEALSAKMVPRIFRRLKLPMDAEMRTVQRLAALHQRPVNLTKGEISDTAIRRLLFDAGEDLEALLILCRADITSKNEKKKERYLANYDTLERRIAEVEARDGIRNMKLAVTGDDIMALFGIPPSKQVGDLRTAFKEAVLDGEVPNERGPGIEFVTALGLKAGLGLAVTP